MTHQPPQKENTKHFRFCPTCYNEDLEIVFVSEDKAFTLCTYNEMAARDYFDPRVGSTKRKVARCNNCSHGLYRCSPPYQCLHHMGNGCGESGYKNNCDCSQPQKHEMSHEKHYTCKNRTTISDLCCLCDEHEDCNLESI